MTVEQPISTSHVWTVNGTHEAVDFYVNHGDQPAITDAKPLEIGPIFTVDGTMARPYGVHTISARMKDDYDGPVLAAASVDLQETLSFAAVLHRLPGGEHQLSIYGNDFTPSADTRLTLRHNAQAGRLDWEIYAEPDENPEIPDDPRSGSLLPGEWQEVLDVTENQYVLKVYQDGELVARKVGLELETEKNLSVYVVGDPQPSSDRAELLAHLLVQEYQVPAGTKRPDVVTEARPPLSSADDNAPVVFDCQPIRVWERNAISTTVSAVDADGLVNNLSIDRIEPDLGSIEIPDGGVTPSPGIGEPAHARVDVGSDVPPGEYRIYVRSNVGTIAQQETCALDLTVDAVNTSRLKTLIRRYQANPYVEGSFGDKLVAILDDVENHLDSGETAAACSDLTKFQDRVNDKVGSKLTTPAADDLTAESGALKSDLSCG